MESYLLSLLYKIWLCHSSMLHWRFNLVYYINLRAQSIPFSMAALCDDNVDGETTMTMFLSHLTIVDVGSSSSNISTIQHPTMPIWVYSSDAASQPSVCTEKTRVWSYRMSNGDEVDDIMSTTTYDNHALLCALWCFINRYLAEPCNGNIRQCIYRADTTFMLLLLLIGVVLLATDQSHHLPLLKSPVFWVRVRRN